MICSVCSCFLDAIKTRRGMYQPTQRNNLEEAPQNKPPNLKSYLNVNVKAFMLSSIKKAERHSDWLRRFFPMWKYYHFWATVNGQQFSALLNALNIQVCLNKLSRFLIEPITDFPEVWARPFLLTGICQQLCEVLSRDSTKNLRNQILRTPLFSSMLQNTQGNVFKTCVSLAGTLMGV